MNQLNQKLQSSDINQFDNKNKVMFNLHQYNSAVRMAQRQQQEQDNYAKYLLRHEDLKEKAVQKQKEKVNSFIRQQSQSEKPFVFEDDHYKHWRPLKQFRDVQDSNKFLSYKTFRHKPNYDMDKYFNERQRIQIRQLSVRKQQLVKSKLIPQQQRSRSLRCQGPLNPKIQFRQRKKDEEYLQPRLRFSNITDRQRFNQSSISYDDKFQSLYKSFEMTKSKIGKTSISPKKIQQGKNQNDLFNQSHSELTKSKNFYFQKEQSYEQNPQVTKSVGLNSKINAQNSQRSNASGNGKTYFKLAKTMHLFGKDLDQKQQLQNLLKRTQYERKKDLTNLRYNMHHQNFIKHPIL